MVHISQIVRNRFQDEIEKRIIIKATFFCSIIPFSFSSLFNPVYIFNLNSKYFLEIDKDYLYGQELAENSGVALFFIQFANHYNIM